METCLWQTSEIDQTRRGFWEMLRKHKPILKVWGQNWLVAMSLSHNLKMLSGEKMHYSIDLLILFLFLFPLFWELDRKRCCCGLCQRVFCLCFPLGVLVSVLTFRSLISFELTFVYGVEEWSNFIFYMWLSSFPSAICRRDLDPWILADITQMVGTAATLQTPDILCSSLSWVLNLLWMFFPTSFLVAILEDW